MATFEICEAASLPRMPLINALSNTTGSIVAAQANAYFIYHRHTHFFNFNVNNFISLIYFKQIKLLICRMIWFKQIISKKINNSNIYLWLSFKTIISIKKYKLQEYKRIYIKRLIKMQFVSDGKYLKLNIYNLHFQIQQLISILIASQLLRQILQNKKTILDYLFYRLWFSISNLPFYQLFPFVNRLKSHISIIENAIHLQSARFLLLPTMLCQPFQGIIYIFSVDRLISSAYAIISNYYKQSQNSWKTATFSQNYPTLIQNIQKCKDIKYKGLKWQCKDGIATRIQQIIVFNKGKIILRLQNKYEQLKLLLIMINKQLMKGEINQLLESFLLEKQDHLLNTSVEQNEQLCRHNSLQNQHNDPIPAQKFDYEDSVVISSEWASPISEESQQLEKEDKYQLINPLIPLQDPQIKKQTIIQDKKQKNSNAIKKIGRIILDNIKQYGGALKKNDPVQTMLKQLSKKSKVGRTEVNKRDKFNTYFLKLLFDTDDKEISQFNLKTTRRILTRNLRQNILNSKQITKQNKLLYLNTLKCSALRCLNKNIAIRLQMSERI